MLSRITVSRFKNIAEVLLPLDRINIVVGSNNSGKSSLLQGIQFAVSAAQTLRALKAQWKKEEVRLSFAPTELIYAPARHVAALAHNQFFTEYEHSAIEVEFSELAPPLTAGEPAAGAPQEICTCVKILKGRGQFIRCIISGANLGRRLQGIVEPFSVLVPGLAGIQTYEEHKAAATVRRAAARGDANIVFRNVLWLLKDNKPEWLQFQTDFKRVFPNREIEVDFNTDQDEHINAWIVSQSGRLPIDAAGTGALQAMQILAYINLSKPKLLILDEPDAHLHPNNQRRLAELLVDLSEARNFQILLSTHSRHLLDALRSDARIHWIRDGARVPDAEYDEVGVLLEVGALDRGDLLKEGKIKCVVLTEDDDTTCIESLLLASGFNLPETDIWSYKGCSKSETAIALYQFITSHAPGVRIVIHRDRDYFTEEEISQYKEALQQACKNAVIFLTQGTDAESHFLDADHLAKVCAPVTKEQSEVLIHRATDAESAYSIRAFINTRTPLEFAKKRKTGDQLDHGALALECQTQYDANKVKYRHGKRVLRHVRNLMQSELKITASPLINSEHIAAANLVATAREIWPPPTATGPAAPVTIIT